MRSSNGLCAIPPPPPLVCVLSFVSDFKDLPKNAALRKLNDFIKRARTAKIHAFIISELRADMPKFFGKGRKQKELIKNLPILFKKVQEEHLVSASDIPPVEMMQEKLRHCDFRKFPLLKDKLIAGVDSMLDQVGTYLRHPV